MDEYQNVSVKKTLNIILKSLINNPNFLIN